MHTQIRVTDSEDGVTAKVAETRRRNGAGRSYPAAEVHVELIGNGHHATIVMSEAQGEQLRDYLVACLGPGEIDPNEPF